MTNISVERTGDEATAVAAAHLGAVVLELAVPGPATILVRRQVGVADGAAQDVRRAPDPLLRARLGPAALPHLRRHPRPAAALAYERRTLGARLGGRPHRRTWSSRRPPRSLPGRSLCRSFPASARRNQQKN